MSGHDIQPLGEPLLECPTCGLPAEVTECFTLDSSDGHIEHVKLVCIRRHWCTLPVDFLSRGGEDGVTRTRPVRTSAIPLE